MDTVKQVSVFLENRRGSLAAVCRVLGENGINVLALSIAETDNFGICRFVLSDTDKGVSVMREAGYTVRVSDVMVISVPDKPCGLSDVLKLLEKEDISVEYLYSFVKNSGFDALLIFKLSDHPRAAAVLKENRVKILSQNEVSSL